MFTDNTDNTVNTVKEVLDVYKKTVEKAKEKNAAFCVLLRVALEEKANNDPMKLLDYKMHVQNYVESKLISFNISVVTLMLTIVKMTNLFSTCVEWNVALDIMLGISAVVTGVLLIYQHITSRKLQKILFVLESEDIKILLNSHKNKEHVKEYRVNEEIAKKFADICKEKKVAEKEQLEKIMQQFVANETKK